MKAIDHLFLHKLANVSGEQLVDPASSGSIAGGPASTVVGQKSPVVASVAEDFAENHPSEIWQTATPGFCVQAYLRGKKILDLEVGETFRYYDWASVTKIVMGTTSCMQAVDDEVLSLTGLVSQYFPEFKSPYRGELQKFSRVRDLLSHSAGMTWWQPFYQSLDLKLSRAERWQQMRGLLVEAIGSCEKLSQRKSVYSDLDYLILGYILEEVREMPLLDIWQDLAERLELSHTHYHVDNKPKYARKYYAPTENCGFRNKIVQGEVHDENAWALGGVAAQAGLFGPIEDLSKWGLFFRESLLASTTTRSSKARKLASPQTVQRFAKRAIPKGVGDWALGLMMPSPLRASCGRYFSPVSVGHTGFTGTSLWFDPKRDLLVVILSNRVNPTRTNSKFVKLRPLMHNFIVESIREEKL